MSLKFWKTRLASEQSKIRASRYSDGSIAAPGHRLVFLAENHQVAVFETRALLGDPRSPIANPKGSWAILGLDVVLDHVVDLADTGQQKILGTNEMELTGSWTDRAAITPTQELGLALHALPGLEGFLYPSSVVQGTCLAVFPDKLGPRSSITFLNEMTSRRERLT